ncbi:MAG TPA: molybdenum cofactor guanylyltransferase [Vicinamibacterales bacterium]|jgi:molybdopterin-guanine dinucleotide biosynthesis protein A|nr:molybdenum cofactor guanylyltransferase [Vicinamibacterales bacterium]
MHSAAILSGGRATRFGGRDKRALIVGGCSILSRQLRELELAAADIMIIGGTPPAEEISTARVLADRVDGCGPLGGLVTALVEARGDAVIVVGCDMPYITGPLAARLLALTAEADAVVPRTGRGYHPLCAAYTRACLAPVERRLRDGRLKMAGLFDDVRVRTVTSEELGAFGDPDWLLANINTPDEYDDLEALQGHKP